MGNTQTSSCLSAFQLYAPDLTGYSPTTHSQNGTVWVNSRQVCSLTQFVHTLPLSQLEQAKKHFQKRYNSSMLVASRYAQCVNLEKGDFTLKIFYERIVGNLSHFKEIPYEDTPHVFSVAFKGFATLKHHYGCFQINESMFHLSEDAQLKIWHSGNIGQEKLEPKLRRSEAFESQMISKIIDTIQANTDIQNGTPTLGQRLLTRKISTFEAASAALIECCAEADLKVKNHISCLKFFTKEDLWNLFINFLDQLKEGSPNKFSASPNKQAALPVSGQKIFIQQSGVSERREVNKRSGLEVTLESDEKKDKNRSRPVTPDGQRTNIFASQQKRIQFVSTPVANVHVFEKSRPNGDYPANIESGVTIRGVMRCNSSKSGINQPKITINSRTVQNNISQVHSSTRFGQNSNPFAQKCLGVGIHSKTFTPVERSSSAPKIINNANRTMHNFFPAKPKFQTGQRSISMTSKPVKITFMYENNQAIHPTTNPQIQPQVKLVQQQPIFQAQMHPQMQMQSQMQPQMQHPQMQMQIQRTFVKRPVSGHVLVQRPFSNVGEQSVLNQSLNEKPIELSDVFQYCPPGENKPIETFKKYATPTDNRIKKVSAAQFKTMNDHHFTKNTADIKVDNDSSPFKKIDTNSETKKSFKFEQGMEVISERSEADKQIDKIHKYSHKISNQGVKSSEKSTEQKGKPSEVLLQLNEAAVFTDPALFKYLSNKKGIESEKNARLTKQFSFSEKKDSPEKAQPNNKFQPAHYELKKELTTKQMAESIIREAWSTNSESNVQCFSKHFLQSKKEFQPQVGGRRDSNKEVSSPYSPESGIAKKQEQLKFSEIQRIQRKFENRFPDVGFFPSITDISENKSDNVSFVPISQEKFSIILSKIELNERMDRELRQMDIPVRKKYEPKINEKIMADLMILRKKEERS